MLVFAGFGGWCPDMVATTMYVPSQMFMLLDVTTCWEFDMFRRFNVWFECKKDFFEERMYICIYLKYEVCDM